MSRKDNSIRIKPESVEDLWHLERIIKEGDRVESVTERKREEASGTFREKMHLTIEVEKVEFHKDYGALKILGTIVEGPKEKISLDAHHSFMIGERDVLNVIKDEWKKHELSMLKEAQRESKQPKITIVVMDERKASVFTIKTYGVDKKADIQLPGKGKYADTGKKGKKYKQITDVLRKTETDKYIVAGPGFEPDNYMKHLREKASGIHKDTVRMKTNNTGERGVYELMKKGEVDRYLKESRLNRETQAIDELIKEVSKGGKATYGEEQVEKAVEYGAVEELLVLDKLLFENEEEISGLMEKTENKNGKVIIISGENPESEKLGSLGGIAALLRYEVS